jgi:hypothetical protein
VFGYGFLRFLLELWRDDVERGSYGPTLDKHVYIPLCLMLLALGFVFGVSLGIANKRARTVARVLAFAPPIVAYVLLKPASFAQTLPYQLSTSQLIGLLSALTVSFFYARFWEDARKNPTLAMSLGDAQMIRELKGESAEPKIANEDEEDEEDEEEAEQKAAPAKTGRGKKKGLAAKPKAEAKAEAEEEDDAKGEPEPEPGAG